MTRISETELILPALYILKVEGNKNTSELIHSLRKLLNPSGEDLKILEGRNDDKFSQKVRNLKSHNALTSQELATEVQNNNNKTTFSITPKGRKLYEKNKHSLNALFTFPLEKTKNLFSDILENDNVDILSEDDSLFFIEGGQYTNRSQKVIKRSAKLRATAFEHYSRNGVIICSSCSFEFNKVYGSNIGKSYIEMHHIVPICDYHEETQLNFDDAIKNIAPLCANCHRVVHNHSPLLSIEAVKQAINHNLD